MMSSVLSMNIDLTDAKGEVINSSSAKQIRKAIVKDLLQDKTVRVQYIRGNPYEQDQNEYDEDDNLVSSSTTVSRGDPYGVVVSRVVNGRLYIGWSLLHTKDSGKYDREFGILQAVSRFNPVEHYLNNGNVPYDVRKTMANLMARNVLYFKGK